MRKFQVDDIIHNPSMRTNRKVVQVTDTLYYIDYEEEGVWRNRPIGFKHAYIERAYGLVSRATPETNEHEGMATQVGGDHYTKMKLQPLEACYLRYGYIGLKATIHTKVDKYFRCKTDEVEDLKKARHCLDILIEKAEKEFD